MPSVTLRFGKRSKRLSPLVLSGWRTLSAERDFYRFDFIGAGGNHHFTPARFQGKRELLFLHEVGLERPNRFLRQMQPYLALLSGKLVKTQDQSIVFFRLLNDVPNHFPRFDMNKGMLRRQRSAVEAGREREH